VLGTIVAVGRNEVEIEARIGLRVGDGIAFADERDPDHEEGGRIYEIFAGRESIKEWRPAVPGRTRRLTLRFAHGGVRFGRLYTGQTVHKTSDQRLDAELRASYEGDRIHSHRPVWAVVSGRVGAPLRLELRDAQGLAVNVEDTAPAEPARTAPLGHEVLTRQIGRLGNTPFELAGLECRLEGELMVPASRLNELRRRAVEELLARRRALLIGRPVDHAALPALRAEVAAAAAATPPQPAAPRLSVLCRTLPQVEAAVAAGCIDTVYTDFEDIRLHREAATILRGTGVTFAPATIRIVKPGDAPFVRMLLKSEPDAILLRNLAAWEILREAGATCAMRGDFSLNIANELAAWAHHRRGITMLTPSYDLNIDQLLDMVGAATPSWFEVTIHQYMPMFHMEHCVFCRFMSEGTDYTNCGRPCEKHIVALRDRVGVDHPVKADAGCRNTVFNGVAQSASEYLDALLGAGLRRFRVDLLDEDTPGTARVITAYRDVLAGRASGRELWRQLRATSKLGVTKGSLDHE
jgi:putative protease